MNIEEILKTLESHKQELQKRFGIKEIGVFGSYVRGEQREDSDLDVLVEFETPVDLFTFLELEEVISRLTGIKVDLVMKKALKPKIGKNILKEVIYV